jgi:hypothetical protein
LFVASVLEVATWFGGVLLALHWVDEFKDSTPIGPIPGAVLITVFFWTWIRDHVSRVRPG